MAMPVHVTPDHPGSAHVTYKTEGTGVIVEVEVYELTEDDVTEHQELQGPQRHKALAEARRAAEAFVNRATDELDAERP